MMLYVYVWGWRAAVQFCGKVLTNVCQWSVHIKPLYLVIEYSSEDPTGAERAFLPNECTAVDHLELFWGRLCLLAHLYTSYW